MKTLNLENFGVLDMSIAELNETEGGKIPWKLIKEAAKEIGISAAGDIAGQYLSGFWDGLTS